MALQNSLPNQIERAIEARLSTHRREKRIRLFTRDDFCNRGPMNRLDIDRVCHLRIRHDRGWVGIYEDDAVTLFLQGLAGLRAGIIELARLADHDRARADNQNALDVSSLGHG